MVQGLTTAAGVWAVAAVGLAVGGGLFLAAVVATGLMLVILSVMKPMERKFFLKRRGLVINVTANFREPVLASMESALTLSGLRLKRLVVRRGEKSEDDQVEISVSGSGDENATKMVAAFIAKVREIPGVREVSFAGSEDH
jgi:putative Mg2+ transporter-C (MgtC) family protein